MANLDVIRELVERWNAGDVEGVMELFAEDAVMYSGADWLEQATWRGHAGIRANIGEWQAVWEMAIAEIDVLEELGDKVVASGAWNTRGRGSGVSGRMPVAMLFTIRDGKITSVEWFLDYDRAVAAAREA